MLTGASLSVGKRVYMARKAPAQMPMYLRIRTARAVDPGVSFEVRQAVIVIAVNPLTLVCPLCGRAGCNSCRLQAMAAASHPPPLRTKSTMRLQP